MLQWQEREPPLPRTSITPGRTPVRPSHHKTVTKPRRRAWLSSSLDIVNLKERRTVAAFQAKKHRRENGQKTRSRSTKGLRSQTKTESRPNAHRSRNRLSPPSERHASAMPLPPLMPIYLTTITNDTPLRPQERSTK